MIEIRLPAFRADGELRTLAEVLNPVGPQPWEWRVLDFLGTSRPGSGFDVLAFEDSVGKSPAGKPCSWDGLLSLARDIGQAIDMSVAAVSDSGLCALVVEARDGTYWRILADDAVPGARAALDRIGAALAG